MGSRLDLDYARETGATFLNARALASARARTSFVEPHQIFDHQGFWADLLSSEALAVNLFGDLAADLDRADQAVHAWWRQTPGRVAEVRFAHSPGRLDPSYSNSRRYFDAVFVLVLPDGSNGALAIDVTYREAVERHGVKPTQLSRFAEIHDRSGAFAPGAIDVLNPSRNTDIAHANDEYRTLLAEDATFTSATIEDLLSAKALAAKTTAVLRRRYLP